MADDDKEMFESALTEEATAEVQPEPEQQPERQPRDEHGRFASSQPPEEQPAVAEPTPEKPAPQEQPKDDQGIPPWRLREEAEARRAAEARAAEHERELAEARRFIAQFQEQNKPKPQVPDIFEDPSAFVDHGVRSAVDPIKSEIGQLREFYSRRDATREHGAEAVNAAYSALDQAARSGDPEAVAVVQRVRQSMHPFGDIVDWHKKQTIISTIGSDPNVWLEKQLEERLKDPKYQAQLMERIRGQAQTRPSVQLPPSLNKTTAALSSQDNGDDDGEAGLLKSALRR